MTRTDSMLVRSTLAVVLALATLAAKSATPPREFATPEAAVDALVQAAKSDDAKALAEIFGSDGKDLLFSGDAVSDHNKLEEFAQSVDEKHSLEKTGDDQATLVFGDDDFPFPIPIVKQKDQWHFDTAAGREEILDRRVGRNELNTIQVCLAYVDAQREYAAIDRNGDGLYEYARKFLSSKGKHDGLYWPDEPNQPESPLGELVADAQSEGYNLKSAHAHPAPYHGYLFKILTAQGPHAQGGAYDYIVHKRMIGGFALVAYPAQYGNSGVMTFLVNHDGEVYSKDLGPNTAKIAVKMTRYDPDGTWKKEEADAAGG